MACWKKGSTDMLDFRESPTFAKNSRWTLSVMTGRNTGRGEKILVERVICRMPLRIIFGHTGPANGGTGFRKFPRRLRPNPLRETSSSSGIRRSVQVHRFTTQLIKKIPFQLIKKE